MKRGMLVICGVLWAGSSLASAQEADTREVYFHSLRERGLHSLAEEYAVTRLRRADQPFRERRDLVVQLVRTLVDHADRTLGSEREELLAEAERQLLALWPAATDPADKMLLQLEGTRTSRSRAEAALWESRLAPEDAKLKQLAVSEVDKATRNLEETLRPYFGSQADRDAASPGLQVEPLMISAIEMRFAQCRLQIELGQLDASSPAGKERLQQAAGMIAQIPSGRLNRTQAAQAALLSSRIARSLNDLPIAFNSLNSIKLTGAPAAIQDEVTSELLRYLAQAGKLDEAVQRISTRIAAAPEPTDELRATAVQVLLQTAQLASAKGQNTLAEQLVKQARTQSERTYGRWGQSARRLVARAGEDAELGPELAAAVRDAQSRASRGEIVEAAATYGRAAVLAQQRGQADKALELALLQGTLLLNAQRYPEAQKALADIVQALPQHSRSAEADLLRCYALGLQAEARGEDWQPMIAALRDHLKRFPNPQSTGEAAWMLAGACERMGQWSDAIAAYRMIPTNHPRAVTAQGRIVEVHGVLLARSSANQPELARWKALVTEDALAFAQQQLQLASAATKEQTQAALSCAALLLRLQRSHTPLAGKLLARVQERILLETRRAEADGVALPLEWQQLELRWTRLRLLQLLNEEQVAEAQRLLARLDEKPDALLAFLTSLKDSSTEIDADQKFAFGTLMQSAMRRLERRRLSLSPAQQLQLDRCGIEAALLVGDYGLAASLLQSLLTDAPQDRELLQRLILVSKQRGQPDDLRRARDAWMSLERLEAPGSAGWLEARVSVAELQVQLAEKDAAKKLLGVTRTLYPQMGNAALKSRSDALWAQLQ